MEPANGASNEYIEILSQTKTIPSLRSVQQVLSSTGISDSDMPGEMKNCNNATNLMRFNFNNIFLSDEQEIFI